MSQLILYYTNTLIVVVVVVSHIQRIGRQREKTTLHGGQSRSWNTVLYYTLLYYAVLYYTILYYTILYYTLLHYTNTLNVEDISTLDYTILYYTILYYTILYYTILYYAKTLIVEATNTLEYYTNIAEKVPFAVAVKNRWTLSIRLKYIKKELCTTYWRQASSNGVLLWKNLNNKYIPRVSASVAKLI